MFLQTSALTHVNSFYFVIEWLLISHPYDCCAVESLPDQASIGAGVLLLASVPVFLHGRRRLYHGNLSIADHGFAKSGDSTQFTQS
jgi:hypothetical protein